MSVTKSDLIEKLSLQANLPKGKAELIVNVLFESMVAALQRGDRIEIRGFGSFEVRDYRAYEGRNPRTGEPVHVKPKRLPFFKVGKELRERVNRNQQAAEPQARGPQQAADPQAADPRGPGATEPAEVSTFAAPATAERITPAMDPTEPAGTSTDTASDAPTPVVKTPEVETF